MAESKRSRVFTIAALVALMSAGPSLAFVPVSHQASKSFSGKTSSWCTDNPCRLNKAIRSNSSSIRSLPKSPEELHRTVQSTIAAVVVSFVASFSSLPAFADVDTAPPTQSLLVESPSPTSNEKLLTSNTYGETWNLVRKYALDQTYHGQDWDEAYTKYSKGVDVSSGDEDRVMKATVNLVGSLGDKYSRMLDKEAYARIQKYDLIGVGATLMPDSDTREIIVGAPPVANSAADQAGLKIGDVIVAVNGKETNGRTAFDIIDQIAEDPNAGKVTFTVRTGKAGDADTVTRDMTLARDLLEVRNPVSYRVSETRADGTIVGYVRIAEFNSLVKANLEAALRDLESQNVNAYVLDIRGNPGGAFQSAVEIAGLFMSDKLATDVVDGNGVELPFRTSKDRMILQETDKIVLWVNGQSASASEVLAGALRDNCRAVVMGDTSFGKGLVQAVYGLKNGSGLVLTVAKYLTPAGTDINKIGIVPDVARDNVVPSAPGFLPLIGSDTTRVDFGSVSKILGPDMCTAPE